MAKGLGLIGNFRGKFGNAVGYNLKDSNNKQTQGIRIYQPIVKNPKTYAQAEQRARMAPINATYRLLKAIIDRGQEGIAYGNKSRRAWLKDAMKAFNGGWIEKGSKYVGPAIVPISKGTLPIYSEITLAEDEFKLQFGSVLQEAPTTLGAVSTAILEGIPGTKAGDQVTLVALLQSGSSNEAFIFSFELDTASQVTLASVGLTATTSVLSKSFNSAVIAGTVIFSRLGDNGQGLRTSSALEYFEGNYGTYMSDSAKESAIRSYMAAGTTTDWPEEPIKD